MDNEIEKLKQELKFLKIDICNLKKELYDHQQSIEFKLEPLVVNLRYLFKFLSLNLKSKRICSDCKGLALSHTYVSPLDGYKGNDFKCTECQGERFTWY